MDDYEKAMLRRMDPSYLETTTLSELFDTAYDPAPGPVAGLLSCGTFIVAGPPKVGKSFLMAQLAYHVSTGTPMWEYPVRKSEVL